MTEREREREREEARGGGKRKTNLSFVPLEVSFGNCIGTGWNESSPTKRVVGSGGQEAKGDKEEGMVDIRERRTGGAEGGGGERKEIMWLKLKGN